MSVQPRVSNKTFDPLITRVLLFKRYSIERFCVYIYVIKRQLVVLNDVKILANTYM